MENDNYIQQEQEDFLNKIDWICEHNVIDYWTILKLLKKVVPLYNYGLGPLVMDSIDRLKTIRGVSDEQYPF